MGLAAVALVGVWWLAHRFPFPLFPHELRRGVVVLHSAAPLPAGAAELVAEADRRLSRSPLYDGHRTYDVFLCDSAGLYEVFAFPNHGTGGETFFWVGNHAFLRPAHLERDALVGPSGTEVAAPRTFTYFLTHEVTHAMTADALGAWRYARLERWQQDGYADTVAKAGAFDVEDALARLRADDPALDPDRLGLYLRYQLLVEHLLEHEHLSVEALLSTPRDAAPIEAALREAR
ncbi:MAG: hypothetical protein K1X89_00645 [Myxococcaceae bacterium]|nr:hypothetical protein [Myxococcaceae bacterium]